jgi:hypothetical protein
MQFEVGGDDGGGELRIGGCSRAGAPDLGRNVVQLLAILHISLEQLYDMRHPYGEAAVGPAYLVCYYGSAGGSGVCCDDHTSVEETAHDGRSGAGGLWERDALGVEGGIAVVVAEVEAWHGRGGQKGGK